MRILACSDIHENISAVRLLRTTERNAFDAIVIAGDIGHDSASEIFGILVSFGCPVLYVYGNWDHKLEYDHSFGPTCKHLHMNPVRCGEYSFVGFSGLPTHWGCNPIAQRIRDEVREKHGDILNRYRECEASVNSAVLQVEADHKARVTELASKAQDRRKLAYRAKVKKLEDQRDARIDKCHLPLYRLYASRDYRAYGRELSARFPEIGVMNRKALVQTIEASGTDPLRTIVVTHERLYRTAEDLPKIPLFLFGHRHRFADTIFLGSRFLNVSALDQAVLVTPAKKKRIAERDYRNMNVGNYVTIETKDSQVMDVKCVRFEPNFDGWKLAGDYSGDYRIVGAPWAE